MSFQAVSIIFIFSLFFISLGVVICWLFVGCSLVICWLAVVSPSASKPCVSRASAGWLLVACPQHWNFAQLLTVTIEYLFVAFTLISPVSSKCFKAVLICCSLKPNCSAIAFRPITASPALMVSPWYFLSSQLATNSKCSHTVFVGISSYHSHSSKERCILIQLSFITAIVSSYYLFFGCAKHPQLTQ